MKRAGDYRGGRMATPAQILANRLNAQKSTGPRSVEGKAAARFNALKHGADAASLIIPGEDPELLAEPTRQFYEDLRPQGPVETALVDTIIRADWNNRRFARIEPQILNALVAAQEPCDYPLAPPGPQTPLEPTRCKRSSVGSKPPSAIGIRPAPNCAVSRNRALSPWPPLSRPGPR